MACYRELYIDARHLRQVLATLVRDGQLKNQDAVDLLGAVGFWNDHAGKMFAT